MTEQEIQQLINERDTYKADAEEAAKLLYGALEVLGIDPDSEEKPSVRKIIKKGTALFTTALVDQENFKKKFSFTAGAVDYAKRYKYIQKQG